MTQATLPLRKLGNSDAQISALGLGCMGFSAFYVGGVDEKSLEVMTLAADLGSTFWDTSDMYGPHTNEKLIGKWFKDTGRRNEIFLATKFAITPDWQCRGDAAYVKDSCQASLDRLGIDCIDLYYQHRVDQATPIEETVGAMAELVKEGKVKYLGLSEASEDTIRRAHKVHPISAYQIEYSPFTLDIEDPKINVLNTCRELGITVVCYSPLGRGMLTGQYRSRADFAKDDWRLNLPRFSEENFDKNLVLVDRIKQIAEKKKATPGQITLAWLLAQGHDIVAIPGTKNPKYLQENVEAAFITLSQEEQDEIRKVSEEAEVVGHRYPENSQSGLFADSPKQKQ